MRKVVFDTSAVISAVLFGRGQLAWLRSHWRDGGCIPLVSRATAEELATVLRYTKFRLSLDRFQEAMAAYLPHCEIVEVLKSCPVKCRDPKDQPYLDLAECGGAESLVSGDRDLLALVGKTRFRIENPAAYRLRVLSVSASGI